jgi:Ca2+-binding RTX toxin-like protein
MPVSIGRQVDATAPAATPVGADTLIANAGNDQLIGGLGPDIVSGGRGRDSHIYRTIEEGGDVIVDYVVKDDTLVFSASGFGGGLVEGQDVVPGITFISGPAPVAPTTAGTFLYDTDAQDLFWDVDGSDPGLSPVKVAHFTSPVALTPDDFDIVA